MRDHYRRTLGRLRTHYESRDECLALILVGSLARGDQKEGSDVDHIVVTTDEEFERRRSEGKSHYWSRDFCDREGQFVEGKFVSQRLIHEAAERGSEPMRYSFQEATVVFSKIPRLAEIVARIPVYQERERQKKIQTFYAHMKVLCGYLGYGISKSDRHVVTQSAAGVALFGGRLVLAHNRMLYPYCKWFVRELERAPEKPENFMRLFHELLAEPNVASAQGLRRTLDDFMSLEQDSAGWISRFVIDTEWAWFSGTHAVQDW